MTKDQQRLLTIILKEANVQLPSSWDYDDSYFAELYRAYPVCDWIDEKISEMEDGLAMLECVVYDDDWEEECAELDKFDYQVQLGGLEGLKDIMAAK